MVDFTKRIEATATAAVGILLSEMMDTAIEQRSKAEYEAGRGSGAGDVALKRIGSGYIGTECARELGFRFHKFPKEEREGPVNKGELRRHAEAGHWAEAKTIEWLRMIGLQINNAATDREGRTIFIAPGRPKQIGWMAARDPETGQYRMAGEVDGVIVGITDLNSPLAKFIKPPCIWENKKATDKKWKKFVKETVKGADPRYYGQLQTNMAYLGATQTLFSMLNLDTMKYHWELIAFDASDAQALSDRAVKTMESNTPFDLPRLCKSDDDFKGKFCDFHDQCWRGLVIKPPESRTIAHMVTLPEGTSSEDVAKAFAALAPKRPIFNPNFKVS